jgi:tripartite-type tricarboxylate transporter receptor subunit TctC
LRWCQLFAARFCRTDGRGIGASMIVVSGPVRRWIAVLAFVAATVCTAPSHTLDFPTHTVRIVIPFSPGGAPDVLVRIVGQALSERWGQPVVIENRAGGNTMVGTVAAARNDPDGYTLLFTGDQTFILNPLLYASLPYSEQDLEPIVLVATSPHLLAVNKTVPARTVQELVALAKEKQRALLYGSTGPGSIQRLATEHFSRIAGIELVHVPYKGAYETTTALISGEITMTINGMAVILPYVPAGQLRALAISTVRRSPRAPDLPTMQEAGVSGYSSQGAFGFMAPTGVPQAIRDKVYKDVVEVLKQPTLKHVLEERSFELSGIGPAEFKSFIADEKAKWRRVITEANIKGD